MESLLQELDKKRVNLPPLDAGKIKYFAAVIMLIDHAASVFLETARTPDGQSLMYSLLHGELIDHLLRAVGRQAFPIFCFFLVEGFSKTRSRLKYFLRLLFFAVLSQYPFQNSIFPRAVHFHASVMCTLAIGLLSIWVIDAMRYAFLTRDEDEAAGGDSPDRREERYGAGGAGGNRLPQRAGTAPAAFYTGLFLLVSCSSIYSFSRLAALLRTDYSYGGVITIVLMYIFQKHRIPGLFISWAWLSWYNKLELYSAPAFFMLACYNGQRGRQHKYFFYIFYPAHLLVLFLLRRHFFGI